MSKKFQLSIPTPCHENWDNMTPVEKGRFCGSCQKQVVDFSRMSDREIAIFFKKPSTGSVCGRFMEDQLDRDIEIPKKRIPWVKYFFQFALPAFLISARATAQGKISQKILTVQKCTSVRSIMGDIDSNIVTEKKKIISDTAMVPIEKKFNDTLVLPEVVLVSYQETFKGKIAISGKIKSVQNRDSTSENTQTCTIRLGGAVAGYQVVKKDTLFQRIKKVIDNVLFQNFKAYPNPAKSGATINIEWKQSETGEYILQIFNNTGQLAFNKEMWIDDEAGVLNFEVPHVAAGNYFLRMTNKNSGKALTEKIIIQ